MIKSEFNEKKKLLQLQKDLEEFKHNSKMKELEYMRVNNTVFHEREMERQRIKSAEIRKNQERKQNFEFARNYPIK